ncbi:GGDEF domain-containing protein [Arcobacter cloacae]|uniref:diguanylate cyclase n=1 Tax=Arcobacter cloacae TaxID=1054034 RepID=A0A4Q0Z9J7_9BACT|nr:GGDEF domain-containing protein [Arcobacter cloacae]
MLEQKFEIFPWNNNFETGIDEIDEQHKKLIELLNNLANLLTQEENFQIETAFSELAKYAEYHFKSEEAVWKKYLKDSDLVVAHEKSHDSFLPKVLEIRNKCDNLQDTIEEIVLFLIRWLAFHIIDEDKRLSLIIHSIKDGKNINEAKYISDELMGGSMKIMVETILSMYDNLSLKAIELIKEKKARLRAEKELKSINIKLHKLSITDQLTGLYNRRYFEEIFNRELQKSKRAKTYINVILFDIDYFKKLNDTYGHDVGDSALKKVSTCLKKNIKRGTDYIFRVGGEEFAIIVTNEDIENLINVTKILQREIKKLAIINEHSTVSKYLTISGGIVSLIPSLEDTIDSIMKKADEKLYEAKEQGRDRFVY